MKFITGSETLPYEGFSGLKNGGIEVCVLESLYDKFPTSSTCSNLLNLPPYNSVEDLKRKLIMAIEMTDRLDGEPGLAEGDGIVLGLQDDTELFVQTNQVESESEVSADEEENLPIEPIEERKAYKRMFTTRIWWK